MAITRDDFPNTIPVTTIEVDSKIGLLIGLRSEVFVPTSRRRVEYPFGTQLFRKGDSIYIQAVEVWLGERHKGHFNSLLEKLWDFGFIVKVPNPLGSMEKILKAKGFERIDEQLPDSSELEVVLVKGPTEKQGQGANLNK